MAERMRWAILGTGKIAKRFAAALNNIPERAELLAVGSRQEATGAAFAGQFHIPRLHVGYEQVAHDPDVDIVYVGTPTVFHQRDVTMCLEAGKHVLCEKAFTINAGEAEAIIALARRRQRFMMEAMWTRFFPIHVRIRQLLAEQAIGGVHGLIANFVATVPFDLTNRFFDVNLGASALLDLGSYGVSWAYSLFGRPDQVTGLTRFGESGADYRSACILTFPGGQLATVTCCQTSYDVKEAVIYGSAGKIEVGEPWYKPAAMTLHRTGREPESIQMPLDGYNGYEYEACAVMDCIERGQTECPEMPLDETISIMQTLDTLRAQWGFKYPFEV
jgi:predicted dehydrogenase